MRCAHFVCHACPDVSADRAREEGYERGFADAVAKMTAEVDAARAEERSAVIAWLTRLPIMSLRTRTMHYESRQIRDGRHVEKKEGV